jgi:hypothetical protein
LALVDFSERLAGTQNHVDEETPDEEDSDKKRGQNLG